MLILHCTVVIAEHQRFKKLGRESFDHRPHPVIRVARLRYCPRPISPTRGDRSPVTRYLRVRKSSLMMASSSGPVTAALPAGSSASAAPGASVALHARMLMAAAMAAATCSGLCGAWGLGAAGARGGADVRCCLIKLLQAALWGLATTARTCKALRPPMWAVIVLIELDTLHVCKLWYCVRSSQLA